LYRDVYYVSTPLAAWLGAAASAAFGATIQTLRALSVGIFVTSAALVWWSAKRVQLGVVGRLLMLVALVVYASPVAHFASIYSALAVLCSLVAFAGCLVWLDTPPVADDARRRALCVVGVAVGLSIASKPNTGILTLGAIIVTIVAHERAH